MDESQRTPWDGLALGATLATLDGGSGYGLVPDGALGWQDGTIVYAGPRTGLPADPNALSGAVVDLGGGLVTPGPNGAMMFTVMYDVLQKPGSPYGNRARAKIILPLQEPWPPVP